MDIKDFLLARIAEDEAAAHRHLPHSRGLGDYIARVLSECEVKRAIIESYRLYGAYATQGRRGEPSQESMGDHELTLWDVLRKLSTVYSDHPDFQQEWAA